MTVIVLIIIQHVNNRVAAVLSRTSHRLEQSLVTSTRPPSNGPGTRARSRTAAAHCEQPAPPESSRNAASLAATAVACVACDPQLVRTPTKCGLLNYLDRELHPGHYCTLSTGSPPRGSTTTYHSRRPVVSYRTKPPDSSGPYTVSQSMVSDTIG